MDCLSVIAFHMIDLLSLKRCLVSYALGHVESFVEVFWIFSIVVIADFRRGLEFVFFSSLRLRTYHCIIDNSTVSEAEDMYTQGHNTFGCPSCNGNCENQREAMHAWASTFLQTPAFCFKAWRDPCLLLALAAPCASILTPLPPWVCVLTQPASVAACAPCGASGRPGKCRWRDFFFWGGGVHSF